MTELEIAVARWCADYDAAPLDRHPEVWAGHYSDTELLGSVYGPGDETPLMFYFMSPFGISPAITDTFIAIDRTREAWFTRLSFDGRGVQVTDWRVEYRFDGHVEIVTADKMWHPIPAVRRAADMHSNRRLKGTDVPFVVSFGASVELGKRHATG